MAIRVLDRIADEIADRFGVVRLAIVHRVGTVGLGEVSILVVAVSPHREAAFAAARYAIDETKARVPIWKAERFVDGHVWIGQPARSAPTDAAGTGPTDAAGTGPTDVRDATDPAGSLPADGGGASAADPGEGR